ncbi:HD-GYP domain-containing protein [Halobacteriovorax sp. DPLXC-1]|uniref:HD-GYP domain-containing protein n=1 Tax=unclassified Halobacteriovorax TaxID=2639665 RepID=UPI002FF0B74B
MKFIPLQITTISPSKTITFDLYIYFKETYLKYQEAGTLIPTDKLEKLTKQKVAKFYIDDKDIHMYQTYIQELMNEKLEDQDLDLEQKVAVVEGACLTAVEQSFQNPDSEKSYEMTEVAAQKLKKVLETGPDALKEFFEKKTIDTDLVIAHSMNVASLATRLAIRVGCSDKEISNISTAALLHDVGLTRLNKQDQELFKKHKEDMNDDEQRIYGLHVKDAISALKDRPWVKKGVLELIVNHEEVLTGKGPNKLKNLTLPIMILSLVNTYDKHVTISGMNPRDALMEITVKHIDDFEHDIINKFKDILIDEGVI